MANASVAQLISRQSVAAALLEARAQATEHQAWLNAINRAALYLAAEQWAFDGEILVIASATTQGARYTVDAHGCSCKAAQAGRPCWHRAARRLLVKGAELAQQPPVERCPMCGAAIEGRQYHISGRGYVYSDVCSGDGSHFSRAA